MPTTRAPQRREIGIEGERVLLRRLTELDATEEYASWLNDPAVNRYLETRSVTIPELRAFIAEKNASDSALLLGIVWKENGKHIGNVKLEPIDRREGVATVGILIGNREYWGRGVATEVVRLVSDHAFTALGLREVRLGVISTNSPAIRVYEKCGFEIYDVKEKAMNHDGVLYDQICMRKLAS